MAKTRAQRKADRRKREARQAAQADQARTAESRAQHDTQVPETADVIEAELAEQGADIDALREEGETPPDELKSPAPSRADVGVGSGSPVGFGEVTEATPEAEDKITRRERKRQEREARDRRKASEERRKPREEPVERQRGRVMAFFISCWAELKRVQWPDRETLIQASAVTLIFITIAAAYLGVLDAIFSQLIKVIL